MGRCSSKLGIKRNFPLSMPAMPPRPEGAGPDRPANNFCPCLSPSSMSLWRGRVRGTVCWDSPGCPRVPGQNYEANLDPLIQVVTVVFPSVFLKSLALQYSFKHREGFQVLQHGDIADHLIAPVHDLVGKCRHDFTRDRIDEDDPDFFGDISLAHEPILNEFVHRRIG